MDQFGPFNAGLWSRDVLQKSYATLWAIREGMLYEMPKHFNLLLVDAGRSATGPEQEAVLQTLVIVALSEMASLPIRFEGYSHIHEEERPFVYETELLSWSKKGGVRIRWRFAFWEGEIEDVRA